MSISESITFRERKYNILWRQEKIHLNSVKTQELTLKKSENNEGKETKKCIENDRIENTWDFFRSIMDNIANKCRYEGSLHDGPLDGILCGKIFIWHTDGT